jgi:hypothetical protein
MARLRNTQNSVVVNVDDDKVARFGPEWEFADSAATTVKKPAAKPAAKATK